MLKDLSEDQVRAISKRIVKEYLIRFGLGIVFAAMYAATFICAVMVQHLFKWSYLGLGICGLFTGIVLGYSSCLALKEREQIFDNDIHKIIEK